MWDATHDGVTHTIPNVPLFDVDGVLELPHISPSMGTVYCAREFDIKSTHRDSALFGETL